MTGPLPTAVLLVAGPASGGSPECWEWEVTPATATAYTEEQVTFEIKSPWDCRRDMLCTWALSTDVGTIVSEDETTAVWTAPADPPPDCEPLDTTVQATCDWLGDVRTRQAEIHLRCTDAQWEAYRREQGEGISIQGGGCTSPGPAAAFLVLLPLGLRRRRSR